MWNKILLTISIVLAVALTSCKEWPLVGPENGPFWQVESTEGDVQITIKSLLFPSIPDEPTADIACALSGGSVCLKHKFHHYLEIVPDTETYSIDAYGFRAVGSACSFEDEWYKVRVDGDLMYIDFKPCNSDKPHDLYIYTRSYAGNGKQEEAEYVYIHRR